MDNLTHTLTGLMLSRAGLHRLTPRAAAVCMIAANIPDLDAVSWAIDTETYFHYHRWLTHSILALPVMAALAVALVRYVGRRSDVRWPGAWLAACIAVASHLLLDLTNHYGVRLFLPWSDTWFTLSTTNVIDLWIWLVLILAVAAPWMGKLVSGEIGARPSTGKGWAVAALTFVLLYDSTRWFVRAGLAARAAERVYGAEAPRQIAVLPNAYNPLSWLLLVETAGAYAALPVSAGEDLNPEAARIWFKPENSPAIDRALSTVPFGLLTNFTRFAAVRTEPVPGEPGSTLVSASDLRFALPPRQRFTAKAIMGPSGKVERAWFEF